VDRIPSRHADQRLNQIQSEIPGLPEEVDADRHAGMTSRRLSAISAE
jgi:hypothetical protein